MRLWMRDINEMEKRAIKILRYLCFVSCFFILISPCLIYGQAKLAPPPLPGDTATGDSAGSTAGPPPPVNIFAEFNGKNVNVGNTVSMVVEISWSVPADEPVPKLGFEFQKQPEAGGMTLFDNSLRSVTELAGATLHVKRTYTYTFHAEEVTESRVPPLTIDYFRLGSNEKRQLNTPALHIDISGPSFEIGQAMRHPAFLAALALIALAAAAALIVPVFVRKGGERKESAPALTVHQKTRETLDNSRRLRMAGEYENYLAALHNTVIGYLEETLAVRLKPQSMDKRGRAVAEKLGDEWEERMLEWERLCDRVRFAGYKPSLGELDSAAETAGLLVDEVEKQYAPEEGALVENFSEDITGPEEDRRS